MFSSPWVRPCYSRQSRFAFRGCWQWSCCHNLNRWYSGASPISLVEHCVTFRHDRRLLSHLGFVHNWPTSRWFATKKENRFSLNRNEIMSSFLGRQFYRSNLDVKLKDHKYETKPYYIYIYIYIYIQRQKKLSIQTWLKIRVKLRFSPTVLGLYIMDLGFYIMDSFPILIINSDK